MGQPTQDPAQKTAQVKLFWFTGAAGLTQGSWEHRAKSSKKAEEMSKEMS